MARDDEERPASRPRHQVGEPLDTMSVDELRMRIDLLHEEIARLEAVIAAKDASRSAAESIFNR